MNKSITTMALFFLIAGSIDSIRNLPATALFGTSLIFFLLFSALIFLIPVALTAAQLGGYETKEPGVYGWVKAAFGQKFGFLAIWLQWINTMVWYPTILSFIAGTLAYIIDPSLAQHKSYLIGVILVTFWLLTLLNLKGLHFSTRISNVCAIVGLVVPVTLVIALAALWMIQGKPIQLHFTSQAMLPSFGHTQNWVSLTAIMTAFLGVELASVHAKQVKNPQRAFPKALIVSIFFIIITMLGGSLAIALVLPKGNIDLVSGLMQVFQGFFKAYHLSWLTPILAIMIILGSLGGMINWVVSPAKGLLHAGENGYLPKFLSKQNSHGVASRLLILQAVLVSVLCLAFLLMPSVNGSYWLLTDLSTQLYILMYVLLFTAAFVLHAKYKKSSGFKIPGGRLGANLVAILGLFGCVVTLIVGFFPPASINVGGVAHYEKVFAAGIVLMVLPVFVFFGYKFLRERKTMPALTDFGS